MPPLSTMYLCDDGVRRTIGEMLDGVDDDFIPKDDQDLLMLLDIFGCDWTKPISHSFMDPEGAEVDKRTLEKPTYRSLTGASGYRMTIDGRRARAGEEPEEWEGPALDALFIVREDDGQTEALCRYIDLLIQLEPDKWPRSARDYDWLLHCFNAYEL